MRLPFLGPLLEVPPRLRLRLRAQEGDLPVLHGHGLVRALVPRGALRRVEEAAQVDHRGKGAVAQALVVQAVVALALDGFCTSASKITIFLRLYRLTA